MSRQSYATTVFLILGISALTYLPLTLLFSLPYITDIVPTFYKQRIPRILSILLIGVLSVRFEVFEPKEQEGMRWERGMALYRAVLQEQENKQREVERLERERLASIEGKDNTEEVDSDDITDSDDDSDVTRNTGDTTNPIEEYLQQNYPQFLPLKQQYSNHYDPNDPTDQLGERQRKLASHPLYMKWNEFREKHRNETMQVKHDFDPVYLGVKADANATILDPAQIPSWIKYVMEETKSEPFVVGKNSLTQSEEIMDSTYFRETPPDWMKRWFLDRESDDRLKEFASEYGTFRKANHRKDPDIKLRPGDILPSEEVYDDDEIWAKYIKDDDESF